MNQAILVQFRLVHESAGVDMAQANLRLILTRPPPPILESNETPTLPQKDNEPGSIEVLLAANR
jgi:hypothetical protein